MTDRSDLAVPFPSQPQITPPSPPSLKISKRIKHLLEYAALRLVAAGISLLPLHSARAAGRSIGLFINFLLGGRANIGRKNLLASFPDMSVDQADALIKKCWENLGEGAADFIKMPAMTRENIFKNADVQGLEHLQKSYDTKKGALIVTAHYGSWELGGKVWPMSGFKTAVVARRVKNPWVNAWATAIRSCAGVRVILARDAVRESIRWLKGGNLLAILIDHRVAEGGLQVPFFGRPALTTGLPAFLALRYQIPVHMVRAWREGETVRVRVEPAMDFAGLSASEADIAEATSRMTQVVECWVRERPEAWLWIHNRWKI